MKRRLSNLLFLPLAGFAVGCQSNPVRVDVTEPQLREIFWVSEVPQSTWRTQLLNAADVIADVPGVIEVTAGGYVDEADGSTKRGDKPGVAFVVTLLASADANEQLRQQVISILRNAAPPDSGVKVDVIAIDKVGTGVEVTTDNRTRRNAAQRNVRDNVNRGRGS